MKTYKQRADSVRGKVKRRRMVRNSSIIAACLCLCLVVGVLFMPYDKTPPSVAMYAGSDYYQLIEMLNEFNYQPPEYNNRFESLMGDLADRGEDFLNGVMMESPGMAPDMDMNGGVTGDSVEGSFGNTEITDHQVAGVYEGDLIKRTETHIFYLKADRLEIYSIAGEDTKLSASWSLSDGGYKRSGNSREMYLSEDGNTVTLVFCGYGDELTGSKRPYVQVISLDVSDPGKIVEKNHIFITGQWITTRLKDGRLLLMSQYAIDGTADFDNPETFVPLVGTEGAMQPIPGDKILLPQEMNTRRYTVVTMLDQNTLELIDAAAFLSYSVELYVSQERIYATRTYSDTVEQEDKSQLTRTMTEISCLGYGADGFRNLGSFTVEGTVKNQYSMDEHEGIFRVVTGTESRLTQKVQDGEYAMASLIQRNANLTCFRVDTWEELARVESFAPWGETVESVRFDGDSAYVCTAVVVTLTDPVFFFDLSDLNNITVKDTGKIDGYSSSLVSIGNGYLLGIGYDDNRQLKVEVYEESADGVVSVCSYQPEIWYFATDYKAYFIDRENQYFGIPVDGEYLLLHFDGYALREVAKVTASGLPDEVRGVVIDEYLYVFSEIFEGVSLAEMG